MRIGIDYYPEQWDETLWQKDADMMAAAGIKVVRLAEFAWSVLEPEENRFDFQWLDEIIDILTERDMDIVLCTPTNCPPLWLYEKYPDAIQTGADGRPISIGIRGHRCYNSPDFLRRTEIIIDKLAEKYRHDPRIIAWQIDNELEANFCRCKYCSSAFREYVKDKYSSVENVNKAYGNSVWSGSYSDWSQVKPPMGSHPKGWYNPALNLDYHRFAAVDTIKFVQFQKSCIRKHFPDTPITTNTWFCGNHVDYHRLFEALDFVSYDNYPAIQLPENEESLYSHAFHLDFMRGIKRQNFWIMEQLSGGLGSWSPMGRQPYPDQIKGYSLQAFAHGADTVVHFRWRTAVQGAEMFWHGLIDHSGIPGRRYEEFLSLCKEAEKLSHISGGEFISKAAVLYDSDTDFALDIQPQTDGFHYLQQLKMWHDAGTSNAVNLDIISSNASLDEYSVVIAPALFITKENTAKKLRDFAEKGGVLVLTARSGVKDENNNCIMKSLPAAYNDMTGAYAEEYCPIGWQTEHIEMEGEQYRISQWCDIMALDGGEALAVYGDSYYKGKAAVTVNSFGKGTVYYVGTVPERKFCRKLMSRIFTECGIMHEPSLPYGIEVTERRKNDNTFRFIFNNTNKAQTFTLYGKSYSMKPFEMITEHLSI